MAEALLYGMAQEVLKNLGSTAVNEIASAWGFKDELNKLKNIINDLKAKMLDAEERQADNRDIRSWVERLTYVVYEADDLFDEFATLVARKQLLGGNKLSVEVRTFFSSSNQIAIAFKFSQKIKIIRQDLDDIANDGARFSFLLKPHEGGRVIDTNRKRDQTYSFVDAEQVIGRDGDKKAVLGLLLPSSCVDEHEELPVIPIIGMGGMGKTTLAQLIYNEARVEEEFGMRLWVCVSDDFDIKVIVKKLLKSATREETRDLEMDQLQNLLREKISDKKYLLVLDDVWSESREEWLELRGLLKHGRKGSKILVTTRSREVAKIMGTSPPHELLGLSEDDSWDLFEMLAFERGQAEQKPNLVKIGKQIVRKCGRVPLAIRTLGSLLYGKEETKWLSLKDTSLAKIPENRSDIMNILKVSYDQLSSPLKNCFAYCALFPKDYMFDKEKLIGLWMAEGFIVDNEGQSLEEVGEEYFLTLLQRCFFQDLLRDECGDIKQCKMHDLMHDLAVEMAGAKWKVANFGERISDDKILHLSFAYPLTSVSEIPNCLHNPLKLLRTFLLLKQEQPMMYVGSVGKSTCPQLLMRLSSLRVLDMSNLELKRLPNSINKLIHLRYLNLSFNTALKKLPDSITDLWNLQTLRLRCCSNLRTLPNSINKLIHLRYLNLDNTALKELPDSITDLWNLQTLTLGSCTKLRTLPTSMRKLTNLRSLDIYSCENLTHMPSGIEGLTSLIKLSCFIVGHTHPTAKLRCKTTRPAKLSDLKNLNNLGGEMEICIHRNSKDNMLEATEAYLSGKQRLIDLTISFNGEDNEDVDCCDHDEAVLEGLKPPFNVRRLTIVKYRGQKLPSWARLNNLCITLPNLVRIKLSYVESCQELPVFSQLRFLKYLSISHMENVEYMEKVDEAVLQSLFFPSLETLELENMKNLKGWRNEEAIEGNNEIEEASYESTRQLIPVSMQFSKLSKLSAWGCPNLRMLPLCPNIEDLELVNNNERLLVSTMATTLSSSTATSSSSGYGWKLKRLTIDNGEYLMFLPNQCLHQLSFLRVIEDRKLESSARLGEVFSTLSSSLQFLAFDGCDKLRSISTGLKHLTSLVSLVLRRCDELDIAGYENEDQDDDMPWKPLNNSLLILRLGHLPKLTGLPRGIRHLAHLRHLYLSNNAELEEIPEWIGCLTSLKDLDLICCPKLNSLPEAFRNLTNLEKLHIGRCPGLTERCRRPDGIDWPKIQYIPVVDIK